MSVAMFATPRLELCYPQEEDFPALYAILKDSEVMSMAFGGQAMTHAVAQAFFKEEFDWRKSGHGLGVLREKVFDRVIGLAGLKASSILGNNDYELGFVLAQDAWGKGYATEIGHAQLEYAYSVLGCKRVLGLVSPENAASRHALMKIGLSYHSTVMTVERGAREIFVGVCD